MQNPFVSILTPVYNGEKYLTECIESVLAQTYPHWEYTIINNCSTDNSLRIAQHYEAKDKRIRVINNSQFVGVIENHNIAFSHVSEKSKYCKVVSADDSVFPDCLHRMVAIAEAHPSIGIVGSYQISDPNKIRWKGLSQNMEFISGHEVCRSTFIDNLDVFGNPTSSLYRADLIRKNVPFFPHLRPHADTSACYKYLQYSDFGFVHKVLSKGRIHDESVSTNVKNLGMNCVASLEIFLQYGPIYLNDTEFQAHKDKMLNNYWRWLGGCLLKLEPTKFWKTQNDRLKELGYPIPWGKVSKGALDEILAEMHNPKAAFNKFITALKGKC